MKFQHYLDYFKNSTVNYLDGFDGEPDSYEFALFQAHRIVYVHKGVTAAEVAKLASMAAQMAERLIDFEDDFKKTVADTCAPDEKHCSCVPHLRRAYYELSNQVVQTLAPHLGFPRAPDENGNEDPNAPYVVDPFIAEDIIGLAGEQFETLLAWKKSNEPRWSSEIPTAIGHYWFYGTTAYERKNCSPMRPETKLVFRHDDGFYDDGDYVDPHDDGWIGKWLKFTPPTPEIDNENG